MKKQKAILVVLLSTLCYTSHGQYAPEEIKKHPCIVGTSAFVLINFIPDEEPPNFIQLNVGYRITTKDIVGVELIKWRYYKPLGIPWKNLDSKTHQNFPGYIQEKGFALTYQRFLWKGLYTSLHIMNAWQDFIDPNDDLIGEGFQIFNTYRLGYHLHLFKKRFFIEPSIAITHRPYHTKMPNSFSRIDHQ